MTGRRVMARRGLGGLTVMAVAGAVIASTASAVAVTTVSNRAVAGGQSAIGCLSATRCVVVGHTAHGVGDLVRVTGGVAGRAVTEKGSSAIDAVSCVAGSGCAAIGTLTTGVGLLVVPVAKGGRVGKAVKVKAPAGVDFDAISCVTATSCELAGIDVVASPEAFSVGAWNGHKLTVRRVAGVKGASPHVADLSCDGTSCLVVGDAEKGSALIGITLAVKRGKPRRVARHPGDLLSSVACVTAVTCYATGADASSGLIQTLTAGRIVRSATVASALRAIACRGRDCTAVGEENPPAGAPASATFYGAIVSVTAGAVDSTASVAAVTGYSDVAMPTGGGFIAVGTSANARTSEVTIG